MNALDDLTNMLEPGETLEAIVFGPWGWGSYREPEPPPVPFDKRGVVLTPEEARPMMEGWSFFGGHGSPSCYAIRAWSDRRVFWVTEYDGSTSLDSAQRHPAPMMPDMPGGG